MTKAELTPAFVRDVRAYAAGLGISPDRWLDFLVAGYRNYAGRIVEAAGNEVSLDTELFSTPSIPYWFREFCRPYAAGKLPRIRCESRERIMVMASILRALDPVGARLWGKTIANDVDPSVTVMRSVSNRSCRYAHFIVPKNN